MANNELEQEIAALDEEDLEAVLAMARDFLIPADSPTYTVEEDESDG